MVWYGNSLFDIIEKYIVIAKYLIKYMIYAWKLHEEYIGCSLSCSHQEKAEIYCIIRSIFVRNDIVNKISNLSNIDIVNVPFLCAWGKGWEGGWQCLPLSLSKQKHLDLQSKLMVSWLALILYYTNSVNTSIGSINKDDISKLLCLSVLFNVTKPI